MRSWSNLVFADISTRTSSYRVILLTAFQRSWYRLLRLCRTCSPNSYSSSYSDTRNRSISIVLTLMTSLPDNRCKMTHVALSYHVNLDPLTPSCTSTSSCPTRLLYETSSVTRVLTPVTSFIISKTSPSYTDPSTSSLWNLRPSTSYFQISCHSADSFPQHVITDSIQNKSIHTCILLSSSINLTHHYAKSSVHHLGRRSTKLVHDVLCSKQVTFRSSKICTCSSTSVCSYDAQDMTRSMRLLPQPCFWT